MKITYKARKHLTQLNSPSTVHDPAPKEIQTAYEASLGSKERTRHCLAEILLGTTPRKGNLCFTTWLRHSILLICSSCTGETSFSLVLFTTYNYNGLSIKPQQFVLIPQKFFTR